MNYRPLNLSDVERQALLAVLESVLATEEDGEDSWMATSKAGVVVVEHLVAKLKRPPTKGKSKP